MKKLIGILIVAITLSACKKEEVPTTGDLVLNINGLEDLGAAAVYEGWLIVGGSPVTTGTFTVDGSGNLSQTSFTIDQSDLDAATAFVLTIEPSPDPSPDPSDVHILAGDFSGSSATVSAGHGSALGDDFSTAAGDYILATPTTTDTTDENSGVWWLDPGAGPGAGLTLPTLPAGWVYEGWAVISGTPVSTGTFTAVDAADGAAPYSGAGSGPPFPGEDFVTNAPSGLTFPTDLSGSPVVISIEPSPDNSPDPFTLKPLFATVPAGAVDHTLYNMTNQVATNFPTGTVTK